MQYLKIQSDYVTGRHWRCASNAVRGAAICLLGHCFRNDLPGRIPGCLNWSEGDWKGAADIRGRDVLAVVEAGLAVWDGDDLVVAGFDHKGARQLEVQKQQGHHGDKGGEFGKLGGRPKKTPQGGIEEPPPRGECETPPYHTIPSHTTHPHHADAPAGGGGDDSGLVDPWKDSDWIDLLDRLGVASGPDAARRWWIQAERNQHAKTFTDFLRVVHFAVNKARKEHGLTVNYASDIEPYVMAWRPKQQGGQA